MREGWVREAKRVWCALLIQIPFWHWQVAKDGHVAYVPQTVWIRNATLKDNVTFSTPFEEIKFNATLRACALDTDIKILPAGYNTEIGERGINLSGGQKARVQLARAVYCGADIFLLDDPLSAVDTHVARRLMDECLVGVLKDMTRVLVTHQIQFLSHADKIIVLDGGKIVAQGKLEDVQAHIDLSTLHHVTEDEHADNQADAAAEDDKAAEMPKEDKEGKLVTEEERVKRRLKTKSLVLQRHRKENAASAASAAGGARSKFHLAQGVSRRLRNMTKLGRTCGHAACAAWWRRGRPAACQLRRRRCRRTRRCWRWPATPRRRSRPGRPGTRSPGSRRGAGTGCRRRKRRAAPRGRECGCRSRRSGRRWTSQTSERPRS